MDAFTQVQTAIEKAALPKEVLARLSAAKSTAKQLDIQPSAIQRVVMLGSDGGGSHIQLFKNFQGSSRAVQDLLDTYGELILMTSGEIGSIIWERKLVLADSEIACQFNDKLKSGNFSSFKSLVESFTGAVERLVAIHLSNALIHYRVSFGDTKNIDVKVWPQTEGLANGTVPYSLTPLLGAYCDPDVWRSFPVAFRNRVQGTLTSGRKDVLSEFRQVIDSVCECTSN
jgi:hypothetical protein